MHTRHFPLKTVHSLTAVVVTQRDATAVAALTTKEADPAVGWVPNMTKIQAPTHTVWGYEFTPILYIAATLKQGTGCAHDACGQQGTADDDGNQEA